ncbi:MAG: hypothetical protein JWR11_807, partial [Mycobacterium sp.]|nr:hypothetical protein [Mycobacterium sp.]
MGSRTAGRGLLSDFLGCGLSILGALDGGLVNLGGIVLSCRDLVTFDRTKTRFRLARGLVGLGLGGVGAGFLWLGFSGDLVSHGLGVFGGLDGGFVNLGGVVLSGGDLIAVDRTKTCFWLACGDLGGDSVSVFRMFDGGFVDLG